ncbi:flagellar hook-basal body complex protein FliE [Bacillus sp. CGMCC 1.16541]|uniref:flagellar hook-basal body complex protein FliE n=1 Tax=Bacillus sp. CGMCC 1.16541 TaxID=2185143 RepID=UPI000D730B0E|nr:flagellar hook-basal body complex protein FliE [Bacillus sp. CGMCC 1.16541]
MINSISNQIPMIDRNVQTSQAISANDVHKQFSTFLKDSINKLNESQNSSDIATEKLVRGEQVDLHEVMIASQKASIQLQTTIEIRNKAVEAYQEIMRMPI